MSCCLQGRGLDGRREEEETERGGDGKRRRRKEEEETGRGGDGGEKRIYQRRMKEYTRMDSVTADGAQRFLPLALTAGAFPQFQLLSGSLPGIFSPSSPLLLLLLLRPSVWSWSGGGGSLGAWDLVRWRPGMMDGKRRSPPDDSNSAPWRVCPKVITK